MATGTFLITELRPTGQPERFEWTSDTTAPSGQKGGARAAPKGGPWAMGITQHMIRTDYPGARVPSHQVMGPRRKPFTLSGAWDDRYNFAGYAEAELERFEQMVQRGHAVRFQRGRQVLEGLIQDFDPEWVGSWRVNYAFTVSVTQRPGAALMQRSPEGPLSATERFGDVDLTVASIQDVQDTAPANQLTGSLGRDTGDNLTDLTVSRNNLGATLDQRTLKPSEQPTASLPKLATSFRRVGAAAQTIVDDMVAIRSDVDLAYRTAASVLSFEEWSRSLRYYGRVLMGRSNAGANDMEERASPNAERLYRPHEGQSLYQIARETLGSADAWRLIAERNGLTEFVMTGDELLIIPERGQG